MKYKIFTRWVIFALCGAIILVVAQYIRFLPFELLLSYTPLLSCLLILGMIISLAIDLYFFRNFPKSRQLVGGLIGGLLICGGVLYISLNDHPLTPISPATRPTLTFAAFNKLYSNKDIAGIADYFRTRQHADVIALEETQPAEIAQLQQRLNYRYSFHSDEFGTATKTVVGIVSKYPITSTKKLQLANGQSLIRTVITTPSRGDMAFYAVHLPGPFSFSLYQERGDSFKTLADIIHRETLPMVLGGDFNTTVFSPDLRQFNAATRTTVQPITTARWPRCSWYGLGRPFCIRIDHIYIPKNAQLVNVTIAPYLGSDHRAVIATFEP